MKLSTLKQYAVSILSGLMQDITKDAHKGYLRRCVMHIMEATTKDEFYYLVGRVSGRYGVILRQELAKIREDHRNRCSQWHNL